jgi:DNA polymerase/3'-5' exonuclease PolX
MSKGVGAPLGLAQTLGNQLVAALKPSCIQIRIAGSVRRERAIVHDLEILALCDQFQDHDLFGFPIKGAYKTKLDDTVLQLAENATLGWRINDAKNGPRLKQLIHPNTGLTCDLTIIMDERAWGSWLAVRTGPFIFSRHMMARAHKLGMHFGDGFLLHNHLKRSGKCKAGPDCPLIIPLHSEADVFAALQIPYVPPEKRDERYGIPSRT